MLGLRRRRRIEGWALDVSSDGETEQSSFGRRVFDSNKAWIICLAALVILTFVFVKNANRTIGGSALVVDPVKAPSEFRDRGRYSLFETELRTDRRFAELVNDVKFLTPGRLQIVMPPGLSADDIDYVAKMAAERVRHLFKHRTVVYVYQTHPNSSARSLVATAQWQPKKHGYAVKVRGGDQRSP